MSRSPFPFHGIFASLGDSGDGDSAFAPQPTTNASLPPPPSPMTSFGEQTQGAQQTGQVAVDIYEQDGYYIIKAPIAGVHLNDLDIEISDNVLTIRGRRAQGDPIPDGQYYLQECFWGEFARSVKLPFSIDPKKVKATFNKECILKIIIPKEEKVKIVRINEG